MHINFAQSRIPALACGPQSEYGCHQTRSQGEPSGGATGAMSPQFQSFQVKKILKYKPKKYFSANQRDCLKEPTLHQLLFEDKLVSELLQSTTASKNNWINAFRSYVWRTSLLHPT